MTAQTLCQEAALRGLRLRPEGDTLVVAPRSKCPPEFADMLRQHKAELLAWLEARATGLTPDRAPWLHVARQVLAGEFQGADGSTRESLLIGLRAVDHPACQEAITRITAPHP
ncbi:MAG: hypothetical protein ABSH34_18615 [Verrucomicrobiota bacterium]|jgi:hypothetical protein